MFIIIIYMYILSIKFISLKDLLNIIFLSNFFLYVSQSHPTFCIHVFVMG